ncbi:glutamine--fructose-6-phosphate transaminase (isomerizing) [bacterium]|nr:glutamine--fructose-6-phosphate transaminase (isomerizing) [bacterium]
MCGIVGYWGKKNSVPILIKGLRRLEYRGYDSAGIAVLDGNNLNYLKRSGKVKILEDALKGSHIKGKIGIAHTRWATHGIPNDINAHPQMDVTDSIALIHNGIIENHSTLREILIRDGVKFRSETDTEVLVQLISSIYNHNGLSLEEAVRAALQKVVGAYGIVLISKDEPDKLIAARFGSPLVIGIGEGEYFVASDAAPIIEYTRKVMYLDEGEMAIISNGELTIKKIFDNTVVSKKISNVEWSVEQIEKGNFPHYMLKEIHEQERTVIDTMRGRLRVEEGDAFLGGIQDFLPRIESARRYYITACGTSWHAGMIGKYLLEEYAGIPVHVEYASEFRYRESIVGPDTVVIAISQSGETADTLAAIRKARDKGALTMGICNVVGSSISRETDCGVYTHAGPEIGVASTKAFTAQVTVLSMFALMLGRRKQRLSKSQGQEITRSMNKLGGYIKEVLADDEQLKIVARATQHVNNYLYLGRGLNFPVALEGALKLKEISYIHAEGYPAAEMKHGPIALIDEKMPVVFIAPRDKTYKKILANIEQVKSRKGITIVFTDKRSEEIERLSDYLIVLPSTHDHIFPILVSIPLQLLAYHLAVLRGCNIDQPRNLAKSVTVE